MTAIQGYVPPTTESGALGVHSLDQFVLSVPDASVAEDFYNNFGLNMERNGNTLAIKTFGHEHRWGLVVEGCPFRKFYPAFDSCGVGESGHHPM